MGQIHIESRNVDGLRVIHEFETEEEMLNDAQRDNPAMGENEILLVIKSGMVLYSSLGKKEKTYEDTLRTTELMEWFE